MRRRPRRPNNAQLIKLVRETSIVDLATLFSGIFALFALLGLVIDILTGGRLSPAAVVRNSLFSGLLAVGYAFGAMRRNPWLFGATAILQVLWFTVVGAGQQSGAVAGNLNHLRADAIGVLVLMIVAYTAFLAFINFTASGYMRVRAEIDLAHEIHQVLVPSLARESDGFEFVGLSRPSGEVGGDLVDVVDAPGGWFGYVADVSGHGVSSGVVMGMFKSALRMRIRQPGPISALLDDLNAVLYPLKSQAMFVTAACVRRGAGNAIEYAVAGHLPILHVSGGTVREITTPQVAIGMFEEARFAAAAVDCAPGDVLALITDGLTEVFDKSDRELGIGAIEALLASMADEPLGTIANAIVAKARAHGRQMDDQTLLLIRRQKPEAGSP